MPIEILIVDNDPIVSTLSSELLRDAGYTTQTLLDGTQALATIRKERPRAVLMDIMMPGTDGLSICHMIKSDPETKDVKVIVVSAKSFDAEKQRALRHGADLFIGKPYDIDAFATQVMTVAGRPIQPPSMLAKSSPLGSSMLKVNVWGSRAATEPPAQNQLTPCVSLETSSNMFIFDAGTGIIPLGQSIINSPQHKDLWIFLTHFHPNHIRSLGLFPCAHTPGYKIHIAGPSDPDKTLEDAVREAIEGSFKVDPKPIEAQLQLYDLKEGTYDILPGVRLRTIYTNHPTTTLSFSIKTLGRHFIYCPDNELHGETASAFEDSDEVLGNAFRDADLLIHDARYAPEDYEANKNKGHSQFMNTVEFAAKHDIKNLLLFHQDAVYSDAQLEAMEKQAQEHIKTHEYNLTCRVAKDGFSLSI